MAHMDNATLQTVLEQIMLIFQTLIVLFLAFGAYLSIVAARDWSESPGEKADRRGSPVHEGSANSAAQAKNELANGGRPATRLRGFEVASR